MARSVRNCMCSGSTQVFAAIRSASSIETSLALPPAEFRVLRALRLLRLLKMSKFNLLLQELWRCMCQLWWQEVAASTGRQWLILVMAIANTSAGILVVAHLLTCFWFYMGRTIEAGAL